MPYIIITRGTCACCDEVRPGLPGAGGAAHLCADCGGSDGRRAVATLDEARGAAGNAVNALPESVDRVRPFYDAIVDLSEQGGTVGPLPDGTVIEVKPVEWKTLRDSAGMTTLVEAFPEEDRNARIIAAFNEAEQDEPEAGDMTGSDGLGVSR